MHSHVSPGKFSRVLHYHRGTPQRLIEDFSASSDVLPFHPTKTQRYQSSLHRIVPLDTSRQHQLP